jgi:hypothetical protein
MKYATLIPLEPIDVLEIIRKGNTFYPYLAFVLSSHASTSRAVSSNTPTFTLSASPGRAEPWVA